jgi:hypothetical protein
MTRTLAGFAILAGFVLVTPGAIRAHAAPAARVVAFPSSQTIPASGALPPGGTRSVSLSTGRGEREGAWIVVDGGGPVAATVDEGTLGDIGLELAWGHFVQVGSRLVPDALLPWDGHPRDAEREHQAIYVRITVPRDVAPGRYRSAISVTASGATIRVPLTVRVFPFTFGTGHRLLTSFHVSPTTYLNAVARLYGLGSSDERRAANVALFRLLGEYGASPSSWGFGEPRTTAGYASSPKWWLDSAANMRDAADSGSFAAMRIPISSNRTSQGSWIAGIDPAQPEHWCDYLQAVRSFWDQQGWLARSVPVLYAQDEPTVAGQQLVALQSKVLHSCWPGARSIMTGNPLPTGQNSFLSDGKDGDDLDVWVVLSRRWYGQYTVPKAQRAGKSRARELAASIQRVRRRAGVWSYTYGGVGGTPGFSADERLSNPRIFLLWNALEGTDGVLYGQGMTSYDSPNPLDRLGRRGGFVLLYPGKPGPIPSARLEQIRDGIEDWALFDALRERRGAGTVRAILGGADLFSADRTGVKLACRLGCEIRSATKYSWPRWSHDASTASRIERARLAALRLAR